LGGRGDGYGTDEQGYGAERCSACAQMQGVPSPGNGIFDCRRIMPCNRGGAKSRARKFIPKSLKKISLGFASQMVDGTAAAL
jgi:hypothetical protein